MSNKKTKNNKNNNLKKEKWCIFKDFTFQTVVERIRFTSVSELMVGKNASKTMPFRINPCGWNLKQTCIIRDPRLFHVYPPVIEDRNHNCLEHPRLEQLYLRSD